MYNLQEIPQKQLLIEGVPAHKYGEWSGLKSSKWTGSKKIIRPRDKENIFLDTNSYLQHGRRHFSSIHSSEIQYRPEKKLFLETRNRTEIAQKKEGIKSLNPNFTVNKMFYPKRHYQEKFGQEKDRDILHIKTFFPDGNTKTLNEFSIEKIIGGKKRINTMETMRNGMLLVAPGDKNYKNPEYNKDFFKDGGLIAGSTSKPNYNKTVSKKADTFYLTLDLSKTTLNPDKLWINKSKKEIEDFDKTYVKTLYQWENNILKDYIKVPVIEKGGVNNKGNNGNSKLPVKKK